RTWCPKRSSFVRRCPEPAPGRLIDNGCSAKGLRQPPKIGSAKREQKEEGLPRSEIVGQILSQMAVGFGIRSADQSRNVLTGAKCFDIRSAPNYGSSTGHFYAVPYAFIMHSSHRGGLARARRHGWSRVAESFRARVSR